MDLNGTALGHLLSAVYVDIGSSDLMRSLVLTVSCFSASGLLCFKRGVQPECGVQDEKCGVQNSIFTSKNQLF